MNVGVHTSHCCKWHGCQYGEDNCCPVVTGSHKQEYSCETCFWEWYEFSEWNEKMKNPKFLEWVKYYKKENNIT